MRMDPNWMVTEKRKAGAESRQKSEAPNGAQVTPMVAVVFR